MFGLVVCSLNLITHYRALQPYLVPRPRWPPLTQMPDHDGILVANTLPAPPIEYQSALPYAGTNPSPAPSAEANTSEFMLATRSCSRMVTGMLRDQPMAKPARISQRQLLYSCTLWVLWVLAIPQYQWYQQDEKRYHKQARERWTYRPKQLPRFPHPSPAHSHSSVLPCRYRP